MGQQTEVWFFNPICTNGCFHTVLINLRCDCHIICSQVTSSKFWCFMYLMIIFNLKNSADPDGMQHFVALHLGLHCLTKYSFRSQWFYIHVQVFIVAQERRASRNALSGKTKLNLIDWLIRYIFVNSRGPYYSVFFPGGYLVNRKMSFETLLIPTYPLCNFFWGYRSETNS